MDGLHLLGTEANDPHGVHHSLVALLVTVQGLGEKVFTTQANTGPGHLPLKISGLHLRSQLTPFLLLHESPFLHPHPLLIPYLA